MTQLPFLPCSCTNMIKVSYIWLLPKMWLMIAGRALCSKCWNKINLNFSLFHLKRRPTRRAVAAGRRFFLVKPVLKASWISLTDKLEFLYQIWIKEETSKVEEEQENQIQWLHSLKVIWLFLIFVVCIFFCRDYFVHFIVQRFLSRFSKQYPLH